MSSDPRIGTIVAGHRVLSVIGRGGMSVVYLAEHLELERRVALKILGPELAEDEAFRERFIRESRVAAELDHPNIVTVYDAGEVDGLLYLSMRYLEGSDLERLLRSATALDPNTAADLIGQCAAGLDAAHARGLVHRDVKPGNVLLGPDAGAYRAYLSDFGVTKRIHTGASLTRSGQFVGTVDYVAPEQIRSDDVDARADVYSLACVAFRCLTGDVPFPRDTEVGTIYAQLQDAPPTPSERRPGLPTGFDAPILRALAKDREARFESCGAFADAILDVVSTSAPLVTRAPRGDTTARGRRRGALVAAVVATVLAVVATSAFLRPWGDDPTTESPSPSAPPPLPEVTWDGSELPTGGVAGAATAAVDVSGTTIVAGWIARDGDRDAAIWSSSGGAWRRSRGSAFVGTADQRIAALHADGDVVLAVGSEAARGDLDAAVWRSTDGGATWSRVDPVIGGLHRTADQAMLAVAHGSEGWIAAGWDRSGDDQDAAVWTSDDGQVWTRQGADPLGGDGRQAIAALATAGGRLVAAGWATGPGGDRDGAVWLRTGGAWSRVGGSVLGGPGDQAVWALAVDATRIVAGGEGTTTGDPRPAVWVSSDGDPWVRATGSGLAGSGSIRSLVGLGGAWVAGGSSGPRGGAVPTVWRSADGLSWTDAPDRIEAPSGAAGDGRGALAAIVDPDPRRLVAVGALVPGSPAAWLGAVT
jgi:serine/threonine-protein kinase